MNYITQSKRIKPTAKSCTWCKHCRLYEDTIGGSVFQHEECYLSGIKTKKLTHRLALKTLKETDFRYCQRYEFSKENFKRWKRDYLEN
ncbi:hypothetical protein [Clostridium algidicarnis]|uniref:hypothetical protein n=1 Tax=Clostridium algidicarnis TaxID=37659 RepID=UPI001C0CAFFC|nr:hypothetical protein [Clostridium algidicarnis]MBU3226775.1 hypothetical protein [Clostridium algidicarnis]MBU3250314.1 hypothetical protein [Clostridium algidicarnis]